ncbi:hypothetical protein H0N98_01250 [Candidatus Micrarchaeota archaeon]|nr:hypothetical protein [Candidatus Micrarchaeota archaeon]
MTLQSKRAVPTPENPVKNAGKSGLYGAGENGNAFFASKKMLHVGEASPTDFPRWTGEKKIGPMASPMRRYRKEETDFTDFHDVNYT